MKSKYKYVRYDGVGRDKTKRGLSYAEAYPWLACASIGHHSLGNLQHVARNKRFATEREAAIYVDKFMLEHGRDPVNILKRKEP